MSKYVYKIQDLKTGKYSLGGVPPTFNKSGKLWTSLKNIKLHLNIIKNNNILEVYKNAIVECYELEHFKDVSVDRF